MSFALGRRAALPSTSSREEARLAVPAARQHASVRGRRAAVKAEACFMGQRLGGVAASATITSSSRRSRRGAVRVNAMFERFTEKVRGQRACKGVILCAHRTQLICVWRGPRFCHVHATRVTGDACI